MRKKNIIIVCILNLLLYVVVFITGGLIISILWNELIPVIFGLTTVNWFQGIELSVLVYALFFLPFNLMNGSDKNKGENK